MINGIIPIIKLYFKDQNISKNLTNIDLKFENNCKGLIIDLHEFKNTNFKS